MTTGAASRDKAKAVFDVSAEEFDSAVLERSREVGVLVDFWASWCTPCHRLSPTLEKLAREADGEWVLAKVDVDQNQSLAGRYGIQGIPAVKAFYGGELVGEFVGVQPEPAVRQFLADVLPQGKADDGLLAEAREQEEAGDLRAAESGYRTVLQSDGDSAAALLGLGRVLLADDREDEAIELLRRVPPGGPEHAEAEALLAQARFRRETDLTGGEIEARRRLAADPDDVEARLSLAAALTARGAYRDALEGLLVVIENDRGEGSARAREMMLDVFKVLGDGHDLTHEYQGRLAALLW